ncbi:immunoglobulin domain-containing protein [Scrofimicrobium sp. R131]|uniref:Immunoglobulin domain-containing protein n=1 Tax=Scrofimicrobium appendicitidis TaxID=3079930 RepID=A0AAU7V5Y3_9ACTO
MQVEEPVGPEIVAVSAGADSSLTLGDTGHTYGFGTNWAGQLGDGSTTNRDVPVEVVLPEGVSFTSVSLRINHALAVGDDGKTYAWGENGAGQLGIDSTLDSHVPVEVEVPDGVSFTSVATGNAYSVAIGSDGKTYAWGVNFFGQLGNNSSVSSPVPVEVALPAGVSFTSVSAGNDHSLALGDDGNAYAWGGNSSGQLGDGSNTNRTVPVLVSAPDGVSFTSVNAGYNFSLAIGNDGKVYGWGDNSYGQLGDSTFASTNAPVEASVLVGVLFTHIATGGRHSVAIGDDGRTYAWGNNHYGQLGFDSPENWPIPGEVATPPGVRFTAVSAGNVHSLAIGDDGKAYSWGFNGVGALGDGTADDRVTPAPVAAEVVVTGVTFGGVDGVNPDDAGSTAPVDNGDGTWSIATPAHVSGPVDVVVSWTLNGIEQTPVTYSNGFTFLAAPTITDPVDQTVTEGDSAEFVVTATGDPAPTVTWESSSDGGASWVPVSDGVSGDGLTLSLDSVTLGDSGTQYRAIATNSEGSVTSAAATLTVDPVLVAPTITDPVDQTVGEGDAATFMVLATGVPAPVVTWEASSDGGVNWEPVTDGVSGDGLTLSLASVVLADSGTQYRATATNSEGSVTSAAATLTVSLDPLAPTITDPVDVTVFDGETAQFMVSASGVPAPVVTWESSIDDGATWVPVTDGVSGDGLTLSLADVTLADSGTQYRATATNSEGSVTSAAATLTVDPVLVAPTITGPVDQTVTEGESADFTVTVTGNPAPTVTWEASSDGGVNWVPVTDGVSGDGLTLSLDSVTLADSGTQYRATATNSEGSVTSAAATLTVDPVLVAPTITGPVDQTVTEGESADFTVTVTGNPAPTVTWEASSDGGVNWVPVTDGVSGDGLTLSLDSVTLGDSGTQYRATATNSEGSVTSEPVTLTVTAAGGNGGGDPEDKDDEVTKELAVTGLATSPLFWVAAVTAVVLGGGLIAGNRAIRSRITN